MGLSTSAALYNTDVRSAGMCPSQRSRSEACVLKPAAGSAVVLMPADQAWRTDHELRMEPTLPTTIITAGDHEYVGENAQVDRTIAQWVEAETFA